MSQTQLNKAMSVPLRDLAKDSRIQEAIRHNPDLKKLQELILRQANMLATGIVDAKVGQDLSKQYLQNNELFPGLYAPMLGVIEDIVETYGEEAGRVIVKQRGAAIAESMFDHLVTAVLKK